MQYNFMFHLVFFSWISFQSTGLKFLIHEQKTKFVPATKPTRLLGLYEESLSLRVNLRLNDSENDQS